MREHLTAADIANEVRMTRSLHRGSFVIVEGDTDARVYGRFFDTEACTIIPANGKDNAIGSLAILERSKFTGVFAIVDNDYWQLDGIEPPSGNVLVTDTHDLETMIICSRALDVVIQEFGKRVKADTVRKTLIDITVPLGYLRWLSNPEHENLYLRFRDLKFEHFIMRRNGQLHVDIDKLVTEALEESRSVPVDAKALTSTLTTLIDAHDHNPWHVCRGHDMIRLLQISLREVYGNRSGRRVSHVEVDKIMRIAYDFNEFSTTALCHAIRKWETAHEDFTVFPRDTSF